MRAIRVDERDSTWERDDPRFRVDMFEGAGNGVTTVDVPDATIEQALESALALSSGDEHIWALALVDDDSRGMRGLVWLSGMDYNDAPSAPHDWQRRRQMQDPVPDGEAAVGAPVLPNGLRVIRVFPEWGSGWPLWENFTEDYRLTGSGLGLTGPLSDALYEWNQTWQDRQEDVPAPHRWQDRGRDLCETVAGRVGRDRRGAAGIPRLGARRPQPVRRAGSRSVDDYVLPVDSQQRYLNGRVRQGFWR